MSWQAYIDDNLIVSGDVDKGAIYSKEGDSVWAASKGFDISSEEMKEVVNCLNGKPDNAYSMGLHIAKEKYIVTVDAEAKVIAGRKGKEGIIITQSNLAILIGHYNESMQAGSTRATVEKLRDYLQTQNY